MGFVSKIMIIECNVQSMFVFVIIFYYIISYRLHQHLDKILTFAAREIYLCCNML